MNGLNNPKMDEDVLFREMKKALPYMEPQDEFRALPRNRASTGVDKVTERN